MEVTFCSGDAGLKGRVVRHGLRQGAAEAFACEATGLQLANVGRRAQLHPG